MRPTLFFCIFATYISISVGAEIDDELASLTAEDADIDADLSPRDLLKGVKTDLLSSGRVQIRVRHARRPASSEDDPNGASPEVAVRLQIKAAAEPFVSRLGESTGIKFLDQKWVDWKCPQSSQKGQMLITGLAKPGIRPVLLFARSFKNKAWAPKPSNTSNTSTIYNTTSNVTAAAPKAGEFGLRCAQAFASHIIDTFSAAVNRSFERLDDDFYLQFAGKTRYDCQPPKGMSWGDLARRVGEGGCLPCYRKGKKGLAVGDDEKPPVCVHKDVALIRMVHPKWPVEHQLHLPQTLRAEKAMEQWGKVQDPRKHNACNYVGCEHSKAAKQTATPLLPEPEAPLLSHSAASSGSGMPRGMGSGSGSGLTPIPSSGQTTWTCQSNIKIAAVVETSQTKHGLSLVARPTQRSSTVGFDPSCGKSFFKHVSGLLQTELAAYRARMQERHYFKEKTGLTAVAKQLHSCQCSGESDLHRQGGWCKNWDGPGTSPWCYVWGGCNVGISTSKMEGGKQLQDCCSDHLLYRKLCPQWAGAGRCSKGGASALGKGVQKRCPKTCGVCKAYVEEGFKSDKRDRTLQT